MRGTPGVPPEAAPACGLPAWPHHCVARFSNQRPRSSPRALDQLLVNRARATDAACSPSRRHRARATARGPEQRRGPPMPRAARSSAAAGREQQPACRATPPRPGASNSPRAQQLAAAPAAPADGPAWDSDRTPRRRDGRLISVRSLLGIRNATRCCTPASRTTARAARGRGPCPHGPMVAGTLGSAADMFAPMAPAIAGALGTARAVVLRGPARGAANTRVEFTNESLAIVI